MKAFYAATAGVPYVEQGHQVAAESRLAGPDKCVVFDLTPVGVDCEPAGHVELLFFLRCVIEALAGCHKAGWAVVDLRWANIVCTRPERWYVIDAAEHAAKFGQPMAAGLSLPDGVGSVATADVDRAQLSRMLSAEMRQSITQAADNRDAQRTTQLLFQTLDRAGTTMEDLLELQIVRTVRIL
jgi:hypothetical protein